MSERAKPIEPKSGSASRSEGQSDDTIEYSLEDLLSGITKENMHPPVTWGPAVGKELEGW